MDNGKQKKSEEKTNKKETNQRSKEVIEPKITITTTVDANLYAKAKANKISWRKALEVGIKFLLDEEDKINTFVE